MRARLGAGYEAWWASYRAELTARAAGLRQQATATGAAAPATASLVIPLVIHIIYDNGGGNIPDAQVYDAVRILNEDYQKLNPDTAAVVPRFKGRVGNVGVEFRLARLDPSGNCTNGITRTYSSLTNQADDNVRGLIKWNVNRYLNVWVVKSMTGNVAGYAYLPCWGGSDDGINILSAYIGSIGAGTPRNSRALTHEIGHYLGLPHTWGGTNDPGVGVNCSDDDGIADTPNTIGSVVGVCNLALATCPGAVDPISNVQNYMDYSYCSAMFTTEQAALMHDGLLGGGFSCRTTLSTAANLQATGVAVGQSLPACAPVAMLSAVSATATGVRRCAGDSVQFRASADNLPPGATATFRWRFAGGQPATSTAAEPVIHYATPGTYAVSLTATSNGIADSVVQPTYVRVGTTTGGLLAPVAISFDGPTFPTDPADGFRSWEIATTATSGTTWEPTMAASVGGLGAVRVRLRQSGNGAIHTLTSPNILIGSAMAAARLRFKVAYAQTSATNTDLFEVAFSVDCGRFWTRRLVRSGAVLAHGVAPRSPLYVPAATDWYELVASLGTLAAGDHLLLRFQATSDNGNALYLDEAVIEDTPLGLAPAASEAATLALVPNPAAGTEGATLRLSLPTATAATLRAYDAVGRLVRAPYTVALGPAGAHEVRLAEVAGHLAPGLYLVELTLADGTRRVVRAAIE